MEQTPRSVASLNAADYNPRSMSDFSKRALGNAITAFGDLSAIVYNVNPERDMLVGGHQRIKDLLQRPGTSIEYTERLAQPDSVGTVARGYVVVAGTDIKLPYREVSWAEDVEKAANVAANHIQGEFVMPLLAKINEQLLAANKQLLDLTGQTEAQISQLVDQFGSKQEIEEADVPSLNTAEPPKSLKGVIYQLGRHRLMCGSAEDPPSLDKLLNGRRAGMIFTDPPYNVNYIGPTAKSVRPGIQNDKMTTADFHALLQEWCANMIRVCDGGIYICMSPKELGALKDAFQTVGGHWHDYIIWVKNHFVMSGADFQHQYEPILYGWADRIVGKYKTPERNETDVWEDISAVKSDFDGEYTRIKIQGFEVRIRGKVEGHIKRKKAQADIWRFNRPAASPEHPTMKPTMLCAEAIKNSSKRGDLVLDLFGGSGSTLIAADEIGRDCAMMELDEKYVDVIRKRYARLHGAEEMWETFCPAVENTNL